MPRAVRSEDISSVQLLLHNGAPLVKSYETMDNATEGGPYMFDFLQAQGAFLISRETPRSFEADHTPHQYTTRLGFSSIRMEVNEVCGGLLLAAEISCSVKDWTVEIYYWSIVYFRLYQSRVQDIELIYLSYEVHSDQFEYSSELFLW